MRGAAKHLTVLAAVIAAITIASPANAAAASDDIRDQQWHLDALRIDEVHAITRGAGVVVGVLDTGVDATHPDLAGSVLNGIDYTSSQPTRGHQDREGHGTAMAGLIAAHGRATGIAPESRILPVRLDPGGKGLANSLIATAIDWAVDHGAKVLCLAIRDDSEDVTVRRALQRAAQHDVVAIAAIGNTPIGPDVFPGAYPEVVAAAGTDRDGNHAAVSVIGPQAQLAAPAVDILSTAPMSIDPDGYHTGTGTSDATAIIAGVAALVRAKFPNLSAAEVIHRMTYTADDKGPPGRDDQYGFGIVNPVKALTADVPPLQPSPSPSTSTAAAGPPKDDDPSPAVIVAAVVGVAALLTIGLILGRRRGVV